MAVEAIFFKRVKYVFLKTLNTYFISTGLKSLYEFVAHSLGAQGHMEPVNRPEDRLRPGTSGRGGARGRELDGQQSNTGGRGDFQVSKQEVQCGGHPAACQGVLQGSTSSPFEPSTESPIRGRGGKEGKAEGQ